MGATAPTGAKVNVKVKGETGPSVTAPETGQTLVPPAFSYYPRHLQGQQRLRQQQRQEQMPLDWHGGFSFGPSLTAPNGVARPLDTRLGKPGHVKKPLPLPPEVGATAPTLAWKPLFATASSTGQEGKRKAAIALDSLTTATAVSSEAEFNERMRLELCRLSRQ